MPPLPEFYRNILDQIKEVHDDGGLTDEQLNKIKSKTSPNDVLLEVRKRMDEKTLDLTNSKWGNVLERYSPAVVERLERFGKVVDVSIQSGFSRISLLVLNSKLLKFLLDPTVAALVWGSIRFLVIVSMTCLKKSYLRVRFNS